MTPREVKPLRWLGALALVVPALGGCGAGSGATGPGAQQTAQQTLHVLAASSLTEVFDELAQEFEADHPGVTVTPVYDSSATLVTQLAEGAPADLVATADLDTMQSAVEAGDVAGPVVFASNRLVMVTPRSNPADLTGFDDLSRAGVTWVACVISAPCGKVAAALARKDHVSTRPSSLEVDVKAVLAKVTSGEADAGLVYATDGVAAGTQVRVFPIPRWRSEINEYPIALTQQTDDPRLAQQFLELVRSAHGQQVLADAGFGPAR